MGEVEDLDLCKYSALLIPVSGVTAVQEYSRRNDKEKIHLTWAHTKVIQNWKNVGTRLCFDKCS